MSATGPKRPRRRLDPDGYRRLREEVLKRDGWRCQSCGTSQKLQVHHQQRRSALGDDGADNLLTLCADCQRDVHKYCKSYY
jgi:5-methylcytosine-specific restriction endonuclease McrA